MKKELNKDEEYSRVLLDEGNRVAINSETIMELPIWADHKKVKKAQLFFLLNINSMIITLFLGMLVIALKPSLLGILQFTKQSSTPMLAYRRFKANGLYAQLWYRYPLKKGSKSWKSLESVRQIHENINRRSTKAGIGIISQTDMAVTQFLFMGLPLLLPDEFGVVGSIEEFESFNHFWRLIGHMLGMEDRFNICGETLDETRSRLKSITEDIYKPALTSATEDFIRYTKTVVEGMWHLDPTLHYDTMIFKLKRATRVPGYHFFESESIRHNPQAKKAFFELSFYTRFRVILDVVIFEYLSKVFVFRWIFNIMRLFMSLLDFFPILAIISFGWKNAFVKIMRTNRE